MTISSSPSHCCCGDWGRGSSSSSQPWYIGELGAEPTQIGGVLALAGLVATATYLPGGIASDRLDRKLTLMSGYVVGAVAALVMASARHWHTLVPGLLLYAVSGFCIPAIFSYVTHASEGENLARTLATVFAAYSLGVTPSPALGGWLVELVGMRMTYLVSAGCFAAATLTVSRVARQPRPGGSQLAAGRELMRDRPFWVLSAVFLLIYFVTYLGQPFAPNFLAEVAGLRLTWIGFLGSSNALGAFVLGLALGRWRAGPRWGLIAAQGLVGFSFLILLRTEAIGLLAVAFFLRGASAATRSLSSAWLGDVLGRRSLGLAYGALSTVFGIANVAAPYAAGWLYAARPALPFALAAGAIPLTMLLTVLVAFAGRHRPQPVTT